MLIGIILIVLYLVAMTLLLPFISLLLGSNIDSALNLRMNIFGLKFMFLTISIGNPYSLPNTDTKTLKQDLNSLEDILNPRSYHVMVLF